METAIAVAMSTAHGERFVDEWLERERVSKDALVAAAAYLTSTFQASGVSVQIGLLTAFVAGWDVHNAFRGGAVVL